ncbi:hypothetical protein ACEWY4_010255 [Coilia grayii]|uniref:Transposase Helix-turn-helix domain-containing protein n=1 Tax=Coilia grayii TaxID=363190 RepID=A0ABD1K204_9TELE
MAKNKEVRVRRIITVIAKRGKQETDRRGFRELLRMDVEDFNFLLEKVKPHIQRKDTTLRKAITARQRLSVTLRFLATGESFRSLSFQYRIGRSTIGQIVTETCEALYTVLKDRLKVGYSIDITCEFGGDGFVEDSLGSLGSSASGSSSSSMTSDIWSSSNYNKEHQQGTES